MKTKNIFRHQEVNQNTTKTFKVTLKHLKHIFFGLTHTQQIENATEKNVNEDEEMNSCRVDSHIFYKYDFFYI